MKKNVFILMALTLLVAFSLTSCNKKNSNSSNTDGKIPESYFDCILVYPEKDKDVKEAIEFLDINDPVPKMGNLLSDDYCESNVNLTSISKKGKFVTVSFEDDFLGIEYAFEYDFSDSKKGIAILQSVKMKNVFASTVKTRPAKNNTSEIIEMYELFATVCNMCFTVDVWF